MDGGEHQYVTSQDVIAKAVQRYANLEGEHDNEWDRFMVRSRSFHDAAEVAAHLGWWLHCWQWKQHYRDEILIIDSLLQ